MTRSPLAILLLLAACDPDGGAKAPPGGDSASSGDTACTPSAEVCNGADDDCDGEVDEEPTDGVSVWPDADGDGYGADTGPARTVCEPAAGEALGVGDCDDADAEVNPAASETCNNGKDDDCDGTANGCTLEGEVEAEWAPIKIVQEAGDYLGDDLQSGDLDGDGVDDLVVVGYLGHREAQGAYFFRGPILRDTETSEALGSVTHDENYSIFSSVRIFGDLDGDGRDDLAVSGYNPDGEWEEGYGYVSLYPGAPENLELAQGIVFTGGSPAFSLRADVDRLALVSRCGEPNYLDEAVWCGAFDPFDHPDVAESDFTFYDAGVVNTQAVGDLDGDGLDEAIFGDSSSVDIVWGPLADAASGEENVAVRCDWSSHTGFGFAGDVDGDGKDDLLIGTSVPASVSIFSGVLPGGRCDQSLALTILLGEDDFAYGERIYTVGDLDGDSAEDWVAAIPRTTDGISSALLYTKLPSGTLDAVESAASVITAAASYGGLGDAAAAASQTGFAWSYVDESDRAQVRVFDYSGAW